MNTKCQICGSENTEVVSGTEIFEYKGHKIEVPGYTKIVCHNCGEDVADPESVEKSMPVLRDAQRTIDGFLTSKEIRKIRKALNMSQDEISVILGGGEKAFARYETGKVLQSKSMDNLLRILREYPEVIKVLLPESEKSYCFTEGKVNYSPYKDDNPFEYIIEGNTFQRIANE